METIRAYITRFADDIKRTLSTLISEHSKIVQWNYSGSGIFTGKNYNWEPLSIDGRRLRSKLIAEYQHFCNLLRSLLIGQPPQVKRTFQDAERVVTETIEQNGMTYLRSTDEARQMAHESIENQIALIENLYDPSEGSHVFVPDTNALIYNPDLEKWDFPDVRRFTIVLTPTVLSEIDQHKINHRNDEVRKKADSLIRRIKGYRTRGRLTDGVPLKNDKSTLVSIAKEPDFSETLPWLDPRNADDRYLASFIEVIRMFPRSAVILVTRDINLQNKAEFAHLPFSEPPEL